MISKINGNVILGGRSLVSIGDIIIEEVPGETIPERKKNIYSIPGRNGNIIDLQDAWEDKDKEYKIFAPGKKEEDYTNFVNSLAEWISASNGYERLEDTFSPDIYRMAYISGEIDTSSFANIHGEAKIKFRCNPEKWLKAGEKTISLKSNGSIRNPSFQKSKPLITVHGNGAGVLQIGSNEINITEIGNSVTVDSNTWRAFNGTTARDSTIKGDYPILLGGINTITFSGGITSVDIIPRWWKL